MGEGCSVVCTSPCCFPSNLGDPLLSPNMVLFWAITRESTRRLAAKYHTYHIEKNAGNC